MFLFHKLEMDPSHFPLKLSFFIKKIQRILVNFNQQIKYVSCQIFSHIFQILDKNPFYDP